MEIDERLNKATKEEIKEYNPFNRTLTSKEINELYNNGDGLTYPFQKVNK